MRSESEQRVPLAIYKPHEGYNSLTKRVEPCSNKTPGLDTDLTQRQGAPVYRCHFCGSTFDINGNDILMLGM